MYQERPNGFLRVSDGRLITERDRAAWAEFIAWVAAGNEPIAEIKRPDEFHDWNGAAWVPNLVRARQFVRQRWKDWIERKVQAGCTVANRPWDADDRFLAELFMTITGMDAGLITPPVTITRRDDVDEQFLTAASVKILAKGVRDYRQTVMQQARTTVRQLPGAATLQTILALLPP